jgi:hypothetical protein
VVGLLTVHLGLLSRKQLFLEEEKSHGRCCVAGSVCNWPRWVCNVGALYGPSTEISPEVSVGFKPRVGEERNATLRVGIAPMRRAVARRS